MMPDKQIERTKQLMGALVRMKPKPHEEIKFSKKAAKNPKTPAPRRKKA